MLVSACALRPSLHPLPSAAVLDARARAAVRNDEVQPRAGGCPETRPAVTIRFAFDSADLMSAERDALNEAAMWLACTPDSSVRIAGQADHLGSADRRREIADQRAAAVAAHLQDRGVAPGRIVRAAPGDDDHGDGFQIQAIGRGW